ncbi:hypothetical protein N7481_011712 [Penicillium waksmanii]|uniref:uncharacterized protein n=1 Tax=Penicillium waksmanii TaxID=69791 RepID=UPI0025488B9B|nr:uncharacterized protein N7481_011712 [Penicillium waksmanii]KAJ5974502.1 hypothetical protein N7481_011712 [Penicillium waksmanii]
MDKRSYCHGDFVLLYLSGATSSTCIILGDTCEFDRVNSPLTYSEMNFAVGHIRCYILFRLRTILPPVSEYGKIHMGVLCAYQLCRWLTTFIFAAQDYNLNNCKLSSPLGVSCAIKKANESFMFITL